MNKADNGSFRKGNVLVVHYTEDAYGTAPRHVRTLCGQAHRRNYFGVMEPERAERFEVNCEKCLAKAATMS